MKTNGEMMQGGSLMPRYYSAWAQYLVRAATAFQEAGFPLFAVSTQNEPEATQTWESCIYSAEQELEFIKSHLGPAIHKAGLDTRITIWDHNRDNIEARAARILSDTDASKYVWGTAFHWYVSEAFENIGRVHDQFPDKHLVFTEGCIEGGAQPGSWETGERYGRNLIGDFNNWNEGFIDWNLLLDISGGPNHAGNLCDAPVIADTENDRLIYNSSYYYIAHFSRFIKLGAVRIFCSGVDPLLCAAFKNPDGCVVVVLQNETDTPVRCAIRLKELEYPITSEAHSISTVIWPNR
jgi:glucosylceramidase